MDRLDKKLQMVQINGALASSQLGERIGLSAMPAWRLRRQTGSGIIASSCLAKKSRSRCGSSITVLDYRDSTPEKLRQCTL